MPTLNKLEYLDETKHQIKSALNTNFNTGITDEDTFRSYVDKIKNIYATWPKLTIEGTNFNTLFTKKGKMVLQPKGNTQQDGIGTNNLFDGILELGTLDYNTGQNSVNNNSIRSKNYIPVSTSSFCLIRQVAFSSGKTIALRYYDNNFAYIGRNAINSFTQSATKETDNSLDTSKAVAYVRFAISGETDITQNFCVRTDGGTTYNPPSPNPDYPQPVKVVTGDNTIKVTGKNLLNTTNTIDGKWYVNGTISDNASWSYINQFIKVEPNTKYTISRDENEIETSQFSVEEFNQNKTFVKHNVLWQNGTNKYTVTTDSNTKYIICQYRNDYAHTNLQFNIGEDRGLYEPYQGKDYEINLGSIELCKIGDYQDYIYKENNKWYKHSEIGKVVLDGSENWIRSGNTSESFFCGALAGVSIPFKAKMGTASDSKTNYFVTGNKGSNAEVFDMYNGTDYYTTFALYLSTSRATDVTTFKNWLGTHNVILYYVLKTPTNTEITDTDLIEQLEALNNAMAFDGQNNISSECEIGNAPARIKATFMIKGGV